MHYVVILNTKVSVVSYVADVLSCRSGNASSVVNRTSSTFLQRKFQLSPMSLTWSLRLQQLLPQVAVATRTPWWYFASMSPVLWVVRWALPFKCLTLSKNVKYHQRYKIVKVSTSPDAVDRVNVHGHGQNILCWFSLTKYSLYNYSCMCSLFRLST